MFKTSKVKVTERQRAILEGWTKNKTETWIPAKLVERSKIILMSAEGKNNKQQARELGVDRQRVRRWRRKWADFEGSLMEAENQEKSDDELAELISEILSDTKNPKTSTPQIKVTERQRKILEGWVRNKASTTHQLVERCKIILMSAEGRTNIEQDRDFGMYYQRVRRWRKRWAEAQSRLTKAEAQGASDKDLANIITDVLSDNPRPGTPTKFSAEQLVQIISVACEPPEESGRPITHWTPKELADEVIKRKIVESISPRHIDRFLKKKT